MRLTSVPIAWSRIVGKMEPICYSVEGLPVGERAVISMAPGGWRLVTELFSETEGQVLYASPTEALEALAASMEAKQQQPGY